MEESVQNCEGGLCKNRPEARAEKDNESVPAGRAGGKSCDNAVDDNELVTNQPAASAAPTKSVRRKNEKDSLAKSPIATLHGQQDLDAFVSTNNAVVIEFMTSWCGACKGIEEYYKELSTSHQEFVRSARVLCDKNKQTKKLAAGHNVNSYPVFIVFKDGIVASRWDGADRGKLESAFERLAGGAVGAGGRGGRKQKGGGRSKRR
jgi:thiol-disulfide isomerase/thioredoxin